MSWQRARNPQQKETRRSDIRAAAADLFAERGFDKAPLSDIAKSAGMSKAALYRYFSSKEEIFLDLLLADYDSWTSDLERNLAPLAGCNDPSAVASAFVATMEQHPRLAALAAILAGVLERNVEEATLVAFKTEANGFGLRAVNAMHAALPGIGTERLYHVMRYSFSLASGLWPQAHPSQAVEKVLEMPEFRHHRVDFCRDVEDALYLMLSGLLASSSTRQD